MIQLALIKGHLRCISMAAAVFVNNSGSEIIERLSSPEAVRLQKFHMLRQFPGCHLPKGLILAPGHSHIRVVIPGDETVVADRPNQRSRIQSIADFIFSADSVNLL